MTPRDSLIYRLRAAWLRTVLFALLWWVLTGGNMDSWRIGAPVVLFVTLVSMVLLPAFFWFLTRIVHFVLFFLWRSLRGSADGAWRTFLPRLPIVPEMIEYLLQLPPGLLRMFGTPSVEF